MKLPAQSCRLFSCLAVLLLVALCTVDAQAQRKKSKKRVEPPQEQPTSLEPAFPKKVEAPKRKTETKVTYDAQKNWKTRKAGLRKTRLKNEKQADLNDISRPPYFGHKKPPKKNPPDKMKYCKTCGIRH